MQRVLILLLVMMLGVCLAAQAEELPPTVTRSVPLEGGDETRIYTLVQEAQGRFSIYVDEGIYKAEPTDEGMTIQAKKGDAKMTLTVLDGDAKALREKAITREIRNDDWEEEFTAGGEGSGASPFPGCSAVYTEDGLNRSIYWFDIGGGKVIRADFALDPESVEGHGVRFWDMLRTLTT